MAEGTDSALKKPSTRETDSAVRVGTEHTLKAELERITAKTAELSAVNDELARTIEERYVELIKRADKKTPLFREIIQAKAAWTKRVHVAERTKPKKDKPIVIDERLHDERIIPEQDREDFLQAFEAVPDTLKRKYAERLRGVFRSGDEVGTITGLQGITFEMTRLNTAISQGLERVDTSGEQQSFTVTYDGYKPRKGRPIDYELGPNAIMKNSRLQIDVPIIRDEKAFVYETKSYPRKEYGESHLARNQTLKYESAIQQGLIDGATIEVRGRMNGDFLTWSMGTRVDEPGAIPNVEILYTIPLPSGKEYRFVLKQGAHGKGLKFMNEERYDEDDHLVVRGVQNALAERKRIIDIIANPHISLERIEEAIGRLDESDEPEERRKALEQLRAHVEDPFGITDRAAFAEYERLRAEGLHEAFRKVPVKINKTNEKNALSEYATPPAIEREITRFQQFLKENPRIADLKPHYILSESQIPAAVQQSIKAARAIADFERARGTDPEERIRRNERQRKGYRGRPEGVALDIEHISADAMYGLNKNGLERAVAERAVGKRNLERFFKPSESAHSKWMFRFRSQEELDMALAGPENAALKETADGLTRRFVRSYEWPERFPTVEKFAMRIQGQDRHYLEIQIEDPKEGKIMRMADTTEEKIAKQEGIITRENIERAREHIKGTRREGHERRSIDRLEAEIARMTDVYKEPILEAKKRADTRAAEIGRKLGNLKRNAATKEEVAALEAERDEAFAEVRRISDEKRQALAGLYAELEKVYRRIIPEQEWNGFAQRITKRIDQNIIKAIYAVRADGEVIVQEEIARGKVHGRATHSELAQGRNVYGAGELVFEKQGEQWVLTEINNGSGHYRPDALDTLPYVRTLIQERGIDTSKAELVDAILRGMPLREADIF